MSKEKSECLTRDSVLVRSHDGLRRNRKALLADLSSLVRTTKRCQEMPSSTNDTEHEVCMMDEMLLKAFRIVTRGVRFLDIWTEEVGLSLSPIAPCPCPPSGSLTECRAQRLLRPPETRTWLQKG